MNHEEKYKQALEKARELMDKGYDVLMPEIFPELQEDKDERIRKALINYFNHHKHGISIFYGIKGEDILAWLEEQGEKKPTDEVEPKFKVGDWITYGQLTCKVLGITDKSYEVHLHNDDYCHFETDIQSVDKYYRLWTIQDAKDGDVLINWNNTAFIFNAIEDGTVKFHIAYNENWDTIKTPSTKLSHLGLSEPQFEFHPATKEQCDLLFSKMKEAGCEWDAERKELKREANLS